MAKPTNSARLPFSTNPFDKENAELLECARKLQMMSPRLISGLAPRGSGKKISRESSKKISTTKIDSISNEPPLSENLAEIEHLWKGLKDHWTFDQNTHLHKDGQHNTTSFKSNWVNLDETDIFRSLENMIVHFEHKLNSQRQILNEFDAQRTPAMSFLKYSSVQKKEQSQFSPVKTSRTYVLQPNEPIKKSLNSSKINPLGEHKQKDFVCSLPISLSNSRVIPSMATSQINEKQGSAQKVISKQIQEDNQRLDALAVEIDRALMKAKEKFK